MDEHRQIEPLFMLVTLLALVACASRFIPTVAQADAPAPTRTPTLVSTPSPTVLPAQTKAFVPTAAPTATPTHTDKPIDLSGYPLATLTPPPSWSDEAAPAAVSAGVEAAWEAVTGSCAFVSPAEEKVQQ